MMKRILCLCLVLALVLPGCGKPTEKLGRQIFAMDTVMDLQVWTTAGEEPLNALQERIYGIESRLSVTRDNSLVGALNLGAEPKWEPEELALLQEVLNISRETGGALDPCLYPVTSLWGFTTGQYRVPSEEEIREVLPLCGADKLTVIEDRVTLAPGSKLDLGAAAKGWTSQQCIELLEGRKDVSCALIYLGGNVQTLGTKPDGSDWRVGIQDPWGIGTLAVLSLTGSHAVVTSGDYQRYFEENGIRYSHIMDPATGAPARSGLASVTIVTENGLRADCLSTALFVMGLEEGLQYWQEKRDFEAVWITPDGRVYATAGLDGRISECEVTILQ